MPGVGCAGRGGGPGGDALAKKRPTQELVGRLAPRARAAATGAGSRAWEVRCRTCGAETLGLLGYARVAHLDGGLAAWRQAGQPTESI